ncbi:hypothetical protein PGTUg99_020977 [Puccinia graminis f. sp. tritici]|uniref:Uncharacterized protein n=1 Tax=Puccinia graminis f. sp. tritici TaxID=56615 RepID=A0A5B0NHS2_PUCGR|nr:hypothetical protein PGTUg99_020977 [Puccinia graminis f. sp. tritici]
MHKTQGETMYFKLLADTNTHCTYRIAIIDKPPSSSRWKDKEFQMIFLYLSIVPILFSFFYLIALQIQYCFTAARGVTDPHAYLSLGLAIGELAAPLPPLLSTCH